MKSSHLALKKGRDLAGHNTAPINKARVQVARSSYDGRQCFCSGWPLRRKADKPLPEKDSNRGSGRRKHDMFKERDFFLSVLGSSATKRDARAYLKHFTPTESLPTSKPPLRGVDITPHNVQRHGVNLGSLFGAARSVENSPKFTHQPGPDVVNPVSSGPLHVALVKIRAPQDMDDETLDGVGLTLSQLGKLGLTSTVVVDCEDISGDKSRFQTDRWRTVAMEQADRVVRAIDAHSESGARLVNNIVGFSETRHDVKTSAACIRSQTHIIYRKLLMTPLKRGVIPVVAAVGYTDETQQAVPVIADDVVLALTREFAGLHAAESPDEHYEATAERLKALRREVSLDRLIILDPLGGIPTVDRPNGYHVFINLEQEFSSIKHDLLSRDDQCNSDSTDTSPVLLAGVSDFARGNPFSQFVETEFGSPGGSSQLIESSEAVKVKAPDSKIHLQNLELTRRVLTLLPPSSSALLTTAEEAANSGKRSDSTVQPIGVGTRKQRNPLIHNLLTDKPVFSSSLPPRRLTQSISAAVENANPSTRIHPTTFAKRGMSVTIYPDPKVHPWKPCIPGTAPLTLEDTRIDLSRLVHLIDDSFNRKLDIEAYLKRVNDRIAGVIIAGEYEGGALLTWELPPGVPDDGSEESRLRMVPYLDKFAVLQRAQGSGGVADILFKTMVRDCFPEGVCWRSRQDNPVNKWYFERSRGTWRLPGTNWTMFWTTPDLDVDQQKFSDYESVCESILPSWADKKTVID